MALNVPEIDFGDLSPGRFHEEIVATARPFVLRGLLADWPVVTAGKAGPEALAACLKSYDRGARIGVKTAPPAERGRLFYDESLTAFNFDKAEMTLSVALDRLLAASAGAEGSLAVQSVQARHAVPGFAEAHPMPLLPESTAPRLWIGSAVTVAAHYDPVENLACVAGGKRCFTLFPPDQVANLYPGPFETTPAGPIVSMVDFDAPDMARYPGFAAALETAMTAELSPGDAIYIPAMWWHHVRSIEPLNMLVNYWWSSAAAHHPPAAPALLHAMLAIKHLPAPQREAWRALFDHYAFMPDGPPGLHLAPAQRGIQGEISEEAAQSVRGTILRSLAQPALPTRAHRLRNVAGRLWRRLHPHPGAHWRDNHSK